MRVGVAIVGYRNPADILACLAALARSTHTDFVVAVRENGGAAAHAALAARLPVALPGGQTVALLPGCDNLGFAGGINRCLAALPEADAWWLLNPDAEPDPVALAALVERLAHRDVAAVGGVLHDEAGRVQSVGGRWWPRWGRSVALGHGAALDALPAAAAVEAQLDWLSGASMLVGRGLIERVGRMREDYFLYAEELEWCLRARAAGLRFGWAPAARVLHRQGSTTGSGRGHRAKGRLPVYLEARNALHVVRDTTPAYLATATAAAPLFWAARYLRRGALRQYRWALAGVAAGVRNERGPPPWLKP